MARPTTYAIRLLSGAREPVRVATTANITLSGLQTIDGIVLVAGDRVLVKDQTDGTENGIYDASEGVWYRSPDARHARTVTRGILVAVKAGNTNTGNVYRFNTLDPDIGDDAISLDLFIPGDTALFDISGAIRAKGATAPTTGTGLMIGYDGANSFVTSYAYPSITAQPIIYDASKHTFKISSVQAMEINSSGNVGIGVAADTTARLHVRPTQSISGAAVFSISDDQNTAVSGAPGAIQLTWGASAGSQWDATAVNPLGNANMVTQTMYATKDTYDAVAWQNTAHLSGGTGSAIVGYRVQAYIDSTATSSRGGTGLETLIKNDTASGDIYGHNIGVHQSVTTTTGAMHGVEYDMVASGATVKYKFGVVIGSTQADSATVTGTLTVNGFADTISGSAAFWTTAFSGGSASGFAHGLMFVKETGGATPISANLIYGGGFSVPYGLNVGRMTFSQAAVLLPNNAPIKAFNAAGNTEVAILNYNSSNLIALGAGLTLDATTGAFGTSITTGGALNISGTAGAGYAQLAGQASAPSTPAANTTRLFANSAGALSLKNANGFIVTFAATSNTADRGYTFPDASTTLVGTDTTQALTNKTVNGRTLANASFFATKNGTDQTGIASVTLTDVTFGTAASNVGGFYNTGTSTWTPPAGPIMITSQLYFTGGVVDQSQFQVSVLKNGSVILSGISFASGTTAEAARVVYVDVANGTDAYKIQAYGAGAGNKTINGGTTVTYFQGTML